MRRAEQPLRGVRRVPADLLPGWRMQRRAMQQRKVPLTTPAGPEARVARLGLVAETISNDDLTSFTAARREGSSTRRRPPEATRASGGARRRESASARASLTSSSLIAVPQ
jgi:hypothetical protein